MPRCTRVLTPGPSLGVALALLVLASGCAGPDGLSSAEATSHSIVIPLDESGQLKDYGTLEQYYGSVFAQMRAALQEGDREGLQELRGLLAQHRREGLSTGISRQLAQYEALATGLAIKLVLPSRCRIQPEGGAGAGSGSGPGSGTGLAYLHQEQKLSFVLAADPNGQVLEIGGTASELPASFLVTVRARDYDQVGGALDVQENLILPVRELHRVEQGKDLEIPFSLPAADPRVVMRELELKVELLPCQVRLDGKAIPIFGSGRRIAAQDPSQPLSRGVPGHVLCSKHQAVLYPQGFEPIRRAPMTTLREALRRGGEEYFKHVFLAAHFMPEGFREEATELLIRQVRNGSDDQARVAMGSLRLLTGLRRAESDRQAWLRWWQRRLRARKTQNEGRRNKE